MVNWKQGVDPLTLGFDECDLWVHVRGLKSEFLTREVAGKIGNAFSGCDRVELRIDKQGKKCFRLKATIQVNAPMRRLCPKLVPGIDCTSQVVYGLWIKKPLEKTWIEFKLVDESMMSGSSTMEGKATPLLLETRVEDEDMREESTGPANPSIISWKIRDEEPAAPQVIGRE
ncbi:hypothetical protein LIER_16692 [Lithospermum erythrorhizon]|uniref:DUF4283 domain-containing protein n=1 Tax=Lithospermum erythrorhizon TaxID=34254 RepID=A0AAV3QA38_LITER